MGDAVKPTRKLNVFVSMRGGVRDIAESLVEALEERGLVVGWQENLESDRAFNHPDQATNMIRRCGAFVLVVDTERWFDEGDDGECWQENEMATARECAEKFKNRENVYKVFTAFF